MLQSKVKNFYNFQCLLVSFYFSVKFAYTTSKFVKLFFDNTLFLDFNNMKKKILYLSGLVFVVCLSANIYSMEDQVAGETQLGQATLFWQINGEAKFRKSLKEYLINQKTDQPKVFTIPSPENSNEAAIEIGREGDLYVNRVERFIIKNPDGKIIVDTNQIKQSDSESLDEVNIKEEAEKLHAGESITAFFSDNAQVHVTFDQLIKLVSKIDESEHPVRLSQVIDSKLVSGAMTSNYQERNEGKIELESTEQEIETFLTFMIAGEEGRKELINKLPIFEHIMLVVDLHFHFQSKKLFPNAWDSLIKKIFYSLKQNDFAWPQEISSLPEDQEKRIQAVMGEILNDIITPIPKVLFRRKRVRGEPNINKDGTKAIVRYLDGTGEVIDLTTGKSILQKCNVKFMQFSPDSRKIHVKYHDNRGEIINLTTGESILQKCNVTFMQFSPDSRKISVTYHDNRGEIIDLTTGESILQKCNVKFMQFSPDSRKIHVKYHDGIGKIIDLTTRKSILQKSNATFMQFSPDSKKISVISHDNKGEIIDLTTGESILKKCNATFMQFSPDSRKIRVIYHDGIGKIIDLTTGESILQKCNVKFMQFSPDSRKISVICGKIDCRGEIIDLTTGESILQKSNATFMKFSPDSTKIIVEYRGDDYRGEIIDLITGESILQKSNATFMKFSPDSTKIIVEYRGDDYRGEIIDLITGNTLLEKSKVILMQFTPDTRKIHVKYSDNRVEIIDLITGNTLLEGGNVEIQATSDWTKAIVTYFAELIGLTGYDQGINFATLEEHQLLFVFNLSQDPDLSNVQDMDKAKQIWQSFKPEVQQILKEAYFPKVDFSLLV